MSVPRFLRNAFEDFEPVDIKEWLSEGKIEVFLEAKEEKKLCCHRCGSELRAERGKYRLKLEGLPILGHRLFIFLWRRKADCWKCKKARAEEISFIADETPHLTREYAYWIGKLCEIAAVSRVAELLNQDETTTWRLDFERMKRMLQNYRIPSVTALSVDEVYARKKPKFEGENRNKRFFTVVTDLQTRRVIWVSEGRDKAALDQFFLLLGKDACKKIRVVAADMHEDYAASVQEHCKAATLVWDRFHVMKNFEEAINDTRKDLHAELIRGSPGAKMTQGNYRFIFLKRASRRTNQEKTHIEEVLKLNPSFMKLELIKERMISFFDQQDELEAKRIFEEIGDWIWQARFTHLMRWYTHLEKGWKTLRNYFRYRVTSALSEGINNVIKMLKRRAFGYKNMEYFRLKIMQLCGYLNSKFIPLTNS